MKALSFNSQDLERELKNVVSIKRYGSLKVVCRLSTLWEPKTMSFKTFFVHYQYIRLLVWISRCVCRRQKWFPSRTMILKSVSLVGLSGLLNLSVCIVAQQLNNEDGFFRLFFNYTQQLVVLITFKEWTFWAKLNRGHIF